MPPEEFFHKPLVLLSLTLYTHPTSSSPTPCRRANSLHRLTGLLGLTVFLALAYAFSTDRRAIRWRTVAWGLGLQIFFAILVIKWTYGQTLLHAGSTAVTALLSHAVDGSSMVFGSLGTPGHPLATFAFAVLPTIIFISAFFALLCGATRSELMTIMTSGMAHVSGGIMAAYISFGINAQDLLSAVIMTAPGTILVAKMLVPETEQPATAGTVRMPPNEEHKNDNFIAAIARGTIDGGKLAFNVAIMLISFLALVGLFNAIMLGVSNFLWAHGHIPFPHSLNAVLGVVGAPVAWLIGIPWHEARAIGNLLGTRAVLNEFVAYTQLGLQKSQLTPRTFSIATFALCGFANIGSIGMQIGGIGALAPNRRNDLAQLGLRAMLAGTMANLMSASIVSILIR